MAGKKDQTAREQYKTLKNLDGQSVATIEIAAVMGISYETVRQLRKKFNLKSRDAGRSYRRHKIPPKKRGALQEHNAKFLQKLMKEHPNQFRGDPDFGDFLSKLSGVDWRKGREPEERIIHHV